jgi:hypothetical protein
VRHADQGDQAVRDTVGRRVDPADDLVVDGHPRRTHAL